MHLFLSTFYTQSRKSLAEKKVCKAEGARRQDMSQAREPRKERVVYQVAPGQLESATMLTEGPDKGKY